MPADFANRYWVVRPDGTKSDVFPWVSKLQDAAEQKQGDGADGSQPEHHEDDSKAGS
jgi:hypothetical protein